MMKLYDVSFNSTEEINEYVKYAVEIIRGTSNLNKPIAAALLINCMMLQKHGTGEIIVDNGKLYKVDPKTRLMTKVGGKKYIKSLYFKAIDSYDGLDNCFFPSSIVDDGVATYYFWVERATIEKYGLYKGPDNDSLTDKTDMLINFDDGIFDLITMKPYTGTVQYPFRYVIHGNIELPDFGINPQSIGPKLAFSEDVLYELEGEVSADKINILIKDFMVAKDEMYDDDYEEDGEDETDESQEEEIPLETARKVFTENKTSADIMREFAKKLTIED